MNDRRLFVGCFVVVLIVIAWGDITQCSGNDRLPWPPRIIMTAVVFGMLDLLSGVLGDVAPLVGVGLVLAALVNNKFTHTDCNARLAKSTPQPASLDVFTPPAPPNIIL